MPRNVCARRPRPRSSRRSSPVASSAHGGAGLERDPQHAREVVAAAAGQHAEHAVECAQRTGDRADQRRRRPARRRSRPRRRARRGPAPGRARGSRRALDVVLEAQPRAARPRRPGAARAARPPPAERVDDQARRSRRTEHQARGGRRRSRPARGRRPPRPAPACVAPVSTIAPSSPARGRPGEVGVEPIADHQRAARRRAGPARSRRSRLGLADARSRCGRWRTRAPRGSRRSPASSPSGGRERAVAAGGDHLGAGSTAWVASAARRRELVVTGDHDDIGLAGPIGVPLTIR